MALTVTLTVGGTFAIVNANPQDSANNATQAYNVAWASDNSCVVLAPNGEQCALTPSTSGTANITISGNPNNAPTDPTTNPLISTTFVCVVSNPPGPGPLDHFAPALAS